MIGLLSPPSNISVTALSLNTTRFSWSPPALSPTAIRVPSLLAPSGYSLELTLLMDNGTQIVREFNLSGSQTSYLVEGLAFGGNYSAQILARNTLGPSVWSSRINFVLRT